MRRDISNGELLYKKGGKQVIFLKKHQKDKKNSREVYLNDDYDDDEDESDDDYEVEEVDELKSYSDAREERKRKKKLRRRRLVSLILALLLALFIFLNWGTFAPARLSETVQSIFSSFGQSKYPVDYNEGSMKTAVAVGSNIGILTDTSFLIYSQNGEQLAVRPHGFNDPSAASGGGKALIYDSGGKQFRVETRFSEPFAATAQNTITTAAMGDSGNFAIVTEADNYLSELTVYDNSYKSIFKWDASQGRILTAALSPDGKKLAAVAVGARNGSMFSDIYIFNLNSETPVAVKKYNGELLYSIRFKDNSRIAAVGEQKSVFLFASGKQASVYSYSDRELECSSNGDGPVVLVFKNGGTKSSVVSLDGEGKLLGKADISVSSATYVNNGDGKTVVVSNGQIWYAADNCSGASKISVSGDVLSAISMKNHAYIFGSQSVGRLNLS
jgi:hypothetical protein